MYHQVWIFRTPENNNYGTLFLEVTRPVTADGPYVLPVEDIQEIAKSQVIQALDLSNVKVTDEGLALLAGMPNLQGIHFDHDSEQVTDAALTALAKSQTLEVIQMLGVFLDKTSQITDQGLKELAKLPRLRVLEMSQFNGTGEGFEAFVEHPTLQVLNLIHAQKLTDEGATYLGRIPHLKQLKIDNYYPTNSNHKEMPALTSNGTFRLPRPVFQPSLISIPS